MPIRFRPRVGPFVWSPNRRPSTMGQVLYALFWLALLVAFTVAVVTR